MGNPARAMGPGPLAASGTAVILMMPVVAGEVGPAGVLGDDDWPP